MNSNQSSTPDRGDLVLFKPCLGRFDGRGHDKRGTQFNTVLKVQYVDTTPEYLKRIHKDYPNTRHLTGPVYTLLYAPGQAMLAFEDEFELVYKP